MKIKNIYLIGLLFIISISTFATENPSKAIRNPMTIDSIDFDEDYLLPAGVFNINYNLGWGVGNFKNFLSVPSYRGFSFDGRYFVSEYISLGGSMGWTAFYEQRERQTYGFDNGTITGVGATTYYNFSMYGNAHYYPFGNYFIKPYLGVNIGAVLNDTYVQIGRYQFEDRVWDFGFAPEVGIYMPFDPNGDMGVNTGLRYNYSFYNNESFKLGNGLAFMQWFIGASFQF
jgi:outer membrane protein